ncbi:MAG TPA: sigma-70 family RNA polymerase sigma factor [Terriglobales bacterium]|nr:sigma-70 family RNA polymerase sigma factor [Terriglobales bacterium]
MKAQTQEAGERLLVEAAQRDPRRFAELYERHFERVYAFVVKRVRDRDAAEDVTSEVFHQALAALPRFQWRGVPFAAWLLRIASNAVKDRWQQSSREAGEPDLAGAADPNSPDVEQRAMLFQLVNELEGDQQRVIVARFVEQQSIRDIAQELGRTEGAVKQLQFRALEKLRARMEGGNA